MKRISAVLVAAALTLGGIAGCSSGTSATSAATIKIGLNLELSGAVASYGQAEQAGAKMAADEINAAGGINGKQIELVVYDDKSDTAEATTLATKLATQDKVIAIMGPATSGGMKAMIPVAVKN